MHGESEIAFAEKPVSSEELMIRDFMLRYLEALRTKKPGNLQALFYAEAKIESPMARRMVSLEEYIKSMRKLLPKIRRVIFRELLIRVESEDMATVYGISRYDAARPGRWWRRTWKLAKTDGNWSILEAYCNR